MPGSGQDNSPGAGSNKPVVRLRGFPKKDADPPASTPATPPKTPGGPPQVRFKPRVASGLPPEDASLPAAAVPDVEEPVPAVATAESSVDPGEVTFEETAVEECATATESPEAPGGVAFQESIPQDAPPAVTVSPSGSGVRLRLPAQTAKVPTATRPEASAAPVGLTYTPDTHQERIERRQWWKYDLRVKAGRQAAPEAQQ